MKLTLITVSEMSTPGPTTRIGVRLMKSLPSYSSRPHVGKSDGKPRPRNDSADSVMMATAMPSAAATMTGLRQLGRMWRKITLRRRVPMLWAAATNSCCLMVSTSPRTTRAVCIQLVMPMMNTMSMKMPCSGPKVARRLSRNNMMMTSNRGSTGRAKNRSVRRMSTPSSRLKKPARTPIVVPRKTDNAMAVMATSSEIRPPTMERATMSRPRLSVPNGWLHVGLRFRILMSISTAS